MRTLGYIATAIIVAAIVIAALYFFLQPVATWFADVTREVTQQSQQYTEAKVSLLLDLVSDYDDPAATQGQQGVIVSRFCEEAARIDTTEWPTPVTRFYATNC
jgi:hypothetical protein